MSSESVKITALEAENVKRVKAVAMRPAPEGLTVIGGRNGQGKTTVLDAIAWALGGDRYRPSEPHREGSVSDPRLKVELSNGLTVERRGKNSSLYVTDPSGKRAGQQLLNSLVEQLALDLPRFLEQKSAEKAKTLLEVIGVGDELNRLEAEEQAAYDKRTAVGQLERQKRALAEEMPFDPDAPAEPVSAAELVQRQTEILGRNAENQRKRMEAAESARKVEALTADLERADAQLAEMQARRSGLVIELARASEDAMLAEKTAQELVDEATDEIEASIAEIDAVNARVRDNERRAAALAEADALKEEYDGLTEQVEAARKEKLALLEGADLPLPGLSVERGELTYNGRQWDGMSGSDQLKVATAIVRALKPSCGFVLVDKLEQFDPATLAEFGEWAASEGLQIIGTRVATDDTCSIVIEDGTSYDLSNGLSKVESDCESGIESGTGSDAATGATAGPAAQPAQKWVV
ncbi:AAA family ATPase [uncultured Adlercreutzia sp.]|uniref:AAA family ATPase n=1 Tax=uncultured Adlercreutzia sp. TaxID=875803 RepID=UPI0025E90888|nr:AAA family ATPase [uncultured Adlercreutzia sp.]